MRSTSFLMRLFIERLEKSNNIIYEKALFFDQYLAELLITLLN